MLNIAICCKKFKIAFKVLNCSRITHKPKNSIKDNTKLSILFQKFQKLLRIEPQGCNISENCFVIMMVSRLIVKRESSLYLCLIYLNNLIWLLLILDKLYPELFISFCNSGSFQVCPVNTDNWDVHPNGNSTLCSTWYPGLALQNCDE